MDVYGNLKKLQLTLPEPPAPKGRYRPCIMPGSSLLFTSGAGSMVNGVQKYHGRVNESISMEEAKKAAELCGINLLSNLEQELGDLNRVKRIIKLTVFVASTPDFTQQAWIADGISELFERVFGSGNGVGTRTAVGVASLPGNQPVEAELVIEYRDKENL